MKWILLAIAALAVIIVFLAFSGFADVPCQDGIRDAAKQTCLPT